jgi:hypothetical protein
MDLTELLNDVLSWVVSIHPGGHRRCHPAGGALVEAAPGAPGGRGAGRGAGA